LKPQIPQISQIRGERKAVCAKYIFVPDAFLQQMRPNLGFSHLRNLRNLRFTSYLGFWG
jgi:hypothetical protein